MVELDAQSVNDEKELSPVERARGLKEMGNKSIEEGKYAKAIEHYDLGNEYIKKVPLDPNVSSLKEAICSNIALALLKIGTREAADRCVLMCDTISNTIQSSSVKIRWRKGKALQILDEVAEAEWEFKEALKMEPNNSAVLLALDELRRNRAKDEQKEKKLYAKFLSKPTGDVASRNHEARDSFQEFVELIKGRRYTFQPENKFQHDLNPPVESRDLVERVLALESLLCRDHANGEVEKSKWCGPLGFLLADMEEDERSLACLLYRESEFRLELAVTVLHCGMGLVACYEFLRLWALGKDVKFGDHSESVKDSETLEALLQAAPRGDERHTALGIFYHTQQKFKESCGHFAAAIQFPTTSYQKAQQWNRLAACLCNSSRYADSIICQHQALSLHDCFPKAWHNVALAMGQCGRSKDAKASLLESRKLYASERVESLIASIDGAPGDAGITPNVEQLAETIRAGCEENGAIN
eukprot:GEMP01033133.1.p1 GENE.GEMP01033133.1~~GEMP01033133.1.p1  ORF type:complete len:471 (+),score=114.90 GEMP01033133.1:183-1595(+)